MRKRWGLVALCLAACSGGGASDSGSGVLTSVGLETESGSGSTGRGTTGLPEFTAGAATATPTTGGNGTTADPDDPAAESSGAPPAPLPCDAEFRVLPQEPGLEVFRVEASHARPLPYVSLTAAGPNTPEITFIDVTSDSPWTWAFDVDGHTAGIYTFSFGNAAEENGPVTVHSTCQVRVLGEGDDSDSDSDSDSDGCVPQCSDRGCGEDDGCGTPCSGGHRDANGAVSDCRIAGNCGCGVEPNDNMQCTDDGMCRVRCSCDCLPPIDKTPAEVAGLDFGGSCALVFEESGDATVWDASNGVALCPLDYDPQGAARCTECPPCHRPQAPECEWSSYCTCTAPQYYPEYSETCCNAGAEYCY